MLEPTLPTDSGQVLRDFALPLPVEEVPGDCGLPPFHELIGGAESPPGTLFGLRDNATIWLTCFIQLEGQFRRYFRINKRVLSRLLVTHGCNPTEQPAELPPAPRPATMAEIKAAAIQAALARHQGNRTHAARELGVSVRTLQRNLKDLPCAPTVLSSASAGTCADSGSWDATCASGLATTA